VRLTQMSFVRQEDIPVTHKRTQLAVTVEAIITDLKKAPQGQGVKYMLEAAEVKKSTRASLQRALASRVKNAQVAIEGNLLFVSIAESSETHKKPAKK
jgi:hypothetical protein